MRRSSKAALLALAASLMGLLLPVSSVLACGPVPEFCDLEVTSLIEQPDFGRAIDVVYVPDGFTSVESLLAACEAQINAFKGQANSKMYAGLDATWNFHIVHVLSPSTNVGNDDTSDTALGMISKGNQTISVNSFRANAAALNAPDADVVVSLANNSSGRANANLPGQLASGGSIRMSKSNGPISHEVGHAVFRLADEYTESALCSSVSESSLADERNVTTDPTCAKFAHIPGTSCVEGAKYCSSGIFRSAGSCLMRSSGNKTMCPACAAAVRDVKLQKRTGVDFASPWGALTSPKEGASVGGQITLTASLFDDTFVPMTATFLVDDRFVGRVEGAATFAQIGFDTRALSDGEHTAEVWVEDAMGHSAGGHAVTFSTSNALGGDGPTVVVSSPSDGATLSTNSSFLFGKITDSSGASATDVESVVASIDGIPNLAWLDSANFSGALFLDGVTPGIHELSVRAVTYAQETSTEAVEIVVAPTSGGEGGEPGGVGGPLDGGNCEPGGQPGSTGGDGCQQEVFFELYQPGAWDEVGAVFSVEFSAFGMGTGDTLTLRRGPAVLWSGGVADVSQGAEGGGASLIIDAADWEPGTYVLELRLDSEGGGSTAKYYPVLRINDAGLPPAVAITSVGDGGTYVAGLAPVAVASGSSDGIASIEIVLDDEIIGIVPGASGTVDWDTSSAEDGCYSLYAVATSGAGVLGLSSSRYVCVDNQAPDYEIQGPLEESGTGLESPAGLAVFRANLEASTAGVDEAFAVLDDGAPRPLGPVYLNPLPIPMELEPGPHTLSISVRELTGLETTQTLTFTAVECTPATCDDDNGCTTDTCASTGVCLHQYDEGCCESDEDCTLIDPCLAGACVAGSCEWTDIDGCCTHSAQCADGGDTCAPAVCTGVGGVCEGLASACCASSADCTAPCGGTPECVAVGGVSACVADGLGCCEDAADCDDGNSCTTDACSGGFCSNEAVEGCCSLNGDCDDANNCTQDLCVAGHCFHNALSWCCDDDTPCINNDPCAEVTCSSNGFCQSNSIPDCCGFDLACDDGDPCTADICEAGACVHEALECCPATPECAGTGCAEIPGDLSGDGEATIADVQCTILVAQYVLAAGTEPAPACTVEGPESANFNCDVEVDVSDVLISIFYALDLALDPAVDANVDGCPDACQL